MRTLRDMNVVKLNVGMAALLLASSCASGELTHDVGERTAQHELDAAAESSGVPLASSVSLQRERYRWAADDWTAGRIEQVGADYLVLTPFIGAVGPRRMEVGNETTVFVGNAETSLRAVAPGTDVRANYVDKTAQSPHLVSLEVLTRAQVERLLQP